MSHPPGCPVVRFDHHSTDFAGDPWSIYDDLRAARVAYSETYGGFYVLSRYEDVRAAARDDETFSSDREVVLPPTGVGRLIPLNADPPDLQRFRSALYPYFTLRAAEAMEADIRRFTTTTIDAFIEAGRCDLITDLAAPVPAMTTLELMGLPPEDWAILAGPLHDLIAYPTDHPNHESARDGVWAIRERFAAGVAERVAAPRDDMITHLLGLEATGTLSRDEVVDLLMMVTIGGFDTTMAAIGSALLYLEAPPRRAPPPRGRSGPPARRRRRVPPLRGAGSGLRTHGHSRHRDRGVPDSRRRDGLPALGLGQPRSRGVRPPR